MKKVLSAILALCMVAALLVGCKKNPEESQAESIVAEPMKITVCVGPDPETLDPALNSSVDGAIILTNAFAGLYGWADVNGVLTIVPECAKEVVEPVLRADGKYQYTVTLKDGLKWSDGVAMKASDFVYAWNRAADPEVGADYQYMFDVIDGYSDEAGACKLNISADDEAGTIVIVTANYCSYFNQLLAFATYYPVRKDIVEGNDNWATAPATYVSNGPFTMKSWTVGGEIVFEKNENYWDAANVQADEIAFFLSDDDDAIYAGFTNGTIQYTTSVPVSLIPVLKNDSSRYNVDFFIGDYIGTYYIEFNVEKSFTGDAFADNEVRKALALLIDRNYIVEQVTGGGQMPADGFVPAGMGDGTGAIFREEADPWFSVDKADYEANCNEAVEILKKYFTYENGKFTDFPHFEFSLNPTSGNKAIAAAIQNMWEAYGISCTLDQREWKVIQTALTEGDFTMSRLGWIADYDDPVNFLEIMLSASGNNHPRLGKAGAIGSAAIYGPNKNQLWADFDDIIAEIKSTSDLEERAALMYEAEEWIRDTGVICPLYYYTNPYLANTNLTGYLYSPLGWVSFKEAKLAK